MRKKDIRGEKEAIVRVLKDHNQTLLPSSKTVFFDTETTGKDPTARLVQIAWALVDEEEHWWASNVAVIKPEGFEIPSEASAIHGITNEIASSIGIALRDALYEFISIVNKAEVLVAHNISYDVAIIENELKREAIDGGKFAQIEKICTMKRTTDFCKLPGPYGYKWPRLEELHKILFQESFSGAHDAMNDVRACVHCYYALKNRKII